MSSQVPFAAFVRAALLVVLALHVHAGALAQRMPPNPQEDDSRAAPTVREHLLQRLGREPKVHEGPVRTSGSYTLALDHAGQRRYYHLHVPPQARMSVSSALVLALHGGGGDMLHMADDRRYGLVAKADAEGFIVAFPNGTSAHRSGKLATWNAGHCCARARETQADDVGFIRAVVADVEQRFNVDRRRVYAIGMSNGAMMAYRLACEASDVVKGIAAVAGTDVTLACSPAAAVPVLHIHAADDDHVLFKGGVGPFARGSDKDVARTSVPDTVAKWVKLNQCSPASKPVLSVAGASCDRYTTCRDGADVQLCVTQDGGHSWPGAGVTRAGITPSKAIVGNDVIWDFFSRR